MSQEMRAAASGEGEDLHEAAIPAGPSVGQQLFAAREARNFSQLDVAQALKISSRQVQALESDDWAGLPGNTIIRGFVRNYARLLGLDADPLMQALDGAPMPQSPKLDFPEGTHATLPRHGRAERRDFAAVFSGVALVVLALLAYFFVPQDFWQSKLNDLAAPHKATEVPAEKTEPQEHQAAVVAPLPVETSAAPAAASAVAVPPTEAPAQPQPQAAQSLAAGTGGGLQLSFAKPSWVEIRDAGGRVIFSQLNPAGSQRDIEGQPPFALVIGNATGVTLRYKGKVVELPQRSKDDVARLTLE
jgi:cytoskeleton protein RodZ